MGMFDWVNFTMPCPECGEEIDGFQSKDRECSMSNIDPDEVRNFYSSCRKCKTWVHFLREYEPPPPRELPFTLDEVKALGFEIQVTPASSKPSKDSQESKTAAQEP